MSAFKALRDVCNNFEEDLRKVNSELFSAKVGETFENGVSKKMRDLSFFTSKLRLLKGKTIACLLSLALQATTQSLSILKKRNPSTATPQVTQKEKGDHTLKEYEDIAIWKVLEKTFVKSITRMHAFKALITSPDQLLDQERLQRKCKIVAALNKYRDEETKLRHLDTLLSEREQELSGLRTQWSCTLGDLRGLQGTGEDEEIEEGPLYLKLRKLVDKLEVMRWLMGRLVAARGRYDWLADPSRRLSALQLARTHNTVQMFIES